MKIAEREGRAGKVEYEVSFEERRLEDIAARLNRFDRNDEKPFEAVAAISDFNQRAYELFMQPLVQATSSELGAKVRRQLHPLRLQRWGVSDLNPWLAWISPAAAMVRARRAPAAPDNALRKLEKSASTAISASLDYYRALRDAMSEAAFFTTYGNVFSLYLADKQTAANSGAERIAEPRELPFVVEALASMSEGGYPEALARVACLLARKGEPLLLSRLQTKQDLIEEYRELMPSMPPDQWRRVRGEQEIIVRYEPDKALATLPALLRDPADRERLVTLVQRLLADQRVQRAKPTSEQLVMIDSIGQALSAGTRRASVKRRAAKPAGKRKPRRTPAVKRKA
jgi:hypothetical protein